MKFFGPPSDTTGVSLAASSGVDCRTQALRSLDRLPPFSPILNRLLASLAHEDVSFAELAGWIERDTVLAGNVLRLVNSALYGLKGTVNSVRHAVAILGLVKLRNVLLGMSISRMWRGVKTPPGWSTAAFNLHSTAVAILADLLVEVVPAPYPEGAFVAGLLHDIGKLLLAVALPYEYGQVLQLIERGEADALECERRVTGADHADLSGAVLERWNLPAPIQRAARFHHAPELAAEGQLDLAHVVQAANLLAGDLGHSMLPPGVEPRQTASLALEGLGVGEALPRLLERFHAEFELIRTFFP